MGKVIVDKETSVGPCQGRGAVKGAGAAVGAQRDHRL
jgi:hypothetical protein